MKARIQLSELEGQIHKGKEFVVASEVKEICGAEVVALNHLDGTAFSASYDIDMLEITDINTTNN